MKRAFQDTPDGQIHYVTAGAGPPVLLLRLIRSLYAFGVILASYLIQLSLARVFGNSPDFWLNVQRRSDLWEAMNSPRERERIKRATPLGTVA